jgi:aspartate/methionine/tyrosine aminotransferase
MPDPFCIGLVNRVRLVGGTPVFVLYRVVDGRWCCVRAAFAAAVSPRTRMVLMMSPAMPSGAVLIRED